jgi:hypothetical protein
MICARRGLPSRRFCLVLLLLALANWGCLGNVPSDSAAAAASVEALKRDLQIKRNSLSAVESRLDSADYDEQLRQGLQRQRDRLADEVQALETRIENLQATSADNNTPPENHSRIR